uniref:DDE Tnp4 domain-containing protein n=1 Tax=Neogobius melanostomus TaxID=47308 RepID=A0A8C6WLY0_9GOBI
MEYLLALRMKRKKERVYKHRTTYLSLTEKDCLKSLHLPRHVVTEVCHLLSKELGSKTTFPLAVRVTSALRFFATGSMSSADGIAKRSMISFVASVSQELVRHADKFIVFPKTPASQALVKKVFKDKFGAPDVLGIIDCTHVVLRAPMENSNMYFNNEGSYSINVQIVCDASSKITHVFTHFPASIPDSSILEKSEIPSIFESDPPLDGRLLGDTAYPLKTWLVTPFSKPKTKPELSFNIMHLDAFEAMDRTVAMLKKRFRCLDKSSGPLQYSPHKVGLFFAACCVLHNIALRHGCSVKLDAEAVIRIRRIDKAMHMPLTEPKTDAVAMMGRAQLAQQLCEK